MKNLLEFTQEERLFLKSKLRELMDDCESGESIISGFNYYYELASPIEIIIAISYLQKSKLHKSEVFKDIKTNVYTKPLLSSERTKEVKLERNKKAIYLFKNSFTIPKDETGKLDRGVEIINFYTEEPLDRNKLNSVNRIEELPEYRDAT